MHDFLLGFLGISLSKHHSDGPSGLLPPAAEVSKIVAAGGQVEEPLAGAQLRNVRCLCFFFWVHSGAFPCGKEKLNGDQR